MKYIFYLEAKKMRLQGEGRHLPGEQRLGLHGTRVSLACVFALNATHEPASWRAALHTLQVPASVHIPVIFASSHSTWQVPADFNSFFPHYVFSA